MGSIVHVRDKSLRFAPAIDTEGYTCEDIRPGPKVGEIYNASRYT